MGTGEAEGEKRSLDAAEAAINNPLLDDVSLKGARGVLVNITGGPDMTLFEVDEACNHIRDQVDVEANIIFGSTFDEELAGRVRVSVVATGIDYAESSAGALAGAERLAGSGAAPSGVITEAVSSTAVRDEVPAAIFAPAQTAKRLFGLTPPDPARTSIEVAQPAPEPAMAVAAEPQASVVEAPVEPIQTSVQPVLGGRRESDRLPVAEQADIETEGEPQYASQSASDTPEAEVAARPRLFEWMKRSGRVPAAGVEPTIETPAQPPAGVTPTVTPKVTEPVTREPVLETAASDLAPSVPAGGPGASPRREDELLDIPAFLRRQST